MSKRIVPPVNHAAFGNARSELYDKNPQHFDAVTHRWTPPAPGSSDHRKLRSQWLKLYAKHGGTVDSGTTFQPATGVVEPCPVKNRIAAVRVLDGGNTEAGNTADQYVNLPRDAKFVAGQVTSTDRCGRAIRVKVEFQRAKKERFKVALLAHNGNATYTQGEQQARASFACQRQAAEHVRGAFDHEHGAVYQGKTAADGTAVVEAQLSVTPAVLDRYKVVAWDTAGNVVEARTEIRTRRMFFYMTVHGPDPHNYAAPAVAFRQGLEAEYAGLGTDLVFLGAENLPNNLLYHDIVMQAAIPTEVHRITRSNNSNRGRPYDDYRPFLQRFVFTDHTSDARKRAIQSVDVDADPADDIDVPIFIQDATQRATDTNFDWRKCLWVGLGAPLDAGQASTTNVEWFESATLTVRHPPPQQPQVIQLAAGDFQLVGRDTGTGVNAKCQLRFNIGNRIAGSRAVSLDAVVVYMSRSVSGQSLTGNDAGITLQPARTHFVQVPANKQLASAIHEFGHAMGMVASAQSQNLTHADFYDYQGQHCHTGIVAPVQTEGEYHRAPLANTGTCVMYGLIPPNPNMHFCAACQAVFKKLDLEAGLSG